MINFKIVGTALVIYGMDPQATWTCFWIITNRIDFAETVMACKEIHPRVDITEWEKLGSNPVPGVSKEMIPSLINRCIECHTQ